MMTQKDIALRKSAGLPIKGFLHTHCFCGDADIPTAGESAREQYEALLKYGKPVANLYKDSFLPLSKDINRTNQDLTFSNAKEQAQFDRDSSAQGGIGSQAVSNDLALQKQVDPEYYDSRTATSNLLQQLAKMSSSIKEQGQLGEYPDLHQDYLPEKGGVLSGSERSEIERGLNRQQGNMAPSTLGTVGNAMVYGQAGRSRELANRSENRATADSALGQTIGRRTENRAAASFKPTIFGQTAGTMAGALPMFKSGIDPYKVATGKSSMAPVGIDQAIGVGNNLANTYGGFQQTSLALNAQKRDALDRVNETMSSI